MTAALTLILRFWPYIAGAALLAGAYFYVDHRGYQRGAEDVRAEWGAASLEAAKKSLAQEKANRTEEQRRVTAQMEAINANVEEVAAARRDAAGAVVAGDRLRAQIGGILATCRPAGNPSALAGGKTASTALDLLPDVFSEMERMGRQLAQEADERRIAGIACERSYDALIGGKE